jgi:hypothetical protein
MKLAHVLLNFFGVALFLVGNFLTDYATYFALGGVILVLLAGQAQAAGYRQEDRGK